MVTNLTKKANLKTKSLTQQLRVVQKSLVKNPTDLSLLFQRGHILYQLQKHKLAKDAFSKAIEVKPDFAIGFNARSIVNHALGKFSDAIYDCEHALSINPRYKEALLNRARAQQELHQYDNALEGYTKAIALDQKYFHGFLGRAVIWKILNHHEKALADLNKALLLDPSSASALVNRGLIQRELERHDECLADLQRAIALQPDLAEAHTNLGNLFNELGRLKEAEASYSRAVALKPNFAEAHRCLALMKKFVEQDEQYTNMLALYRDENLSKENRCSINFGLAKACEDLGDLEQAFSHYLEGNSLRKELLNYNSSQDVELFGKIKASYPQIKQHTLDPNKITKKLKPVFIVGMPRSGTTLVEQIISSHPNATGAGELDYVSKFGKQLTDDSSPINIASLLDFRDKYLEKLGNLSKGNLTVTDKMPQNFLFIGLIAAAFPEAKIVHVKRNPAAVCWANYKQYFTSNNIGFCYSISDVLNFHKLYENLMHFWTNTLSERIYNLDYELLTVNQETETRKLIDYLSLEWDESCLSPQNNNRLVATASNIQVRKKVYKGSSHQWKKYEPFLNGVFDHFL